MAPPLPGAKLLGGLQDPQPFPISDTQPSPSLEPGAISKAVKLLEMQKAQGMGLVGLNTKR